MREANVWKVVTVVAVLFLLLLFLALVADNEKVGVALDWMKTLVGIFVVVAGVGSSAVSLMVLESQNRLLGVGPGVVGVLAGSALLGVGEWAAPVALGIAGLGMGIGYGLKR